MNAILPDSVKLKFLPSDEFSKAQVRNNPSIPASMLLLHLILKKSKTWNHVLDYLEKKWQHVDKLRQRLKIHYNDTNNQSSVNIIAASLSRAVGDSLLKHPSIQAFLQTQRQPMTTINENIHKDPTHNDSKTEVVEVELYYTLNSVDNLLPLPPSEAVKSSKKTSQQQHLQPHGIKKDVTNSTTTAVAAGSSAYMPPPLFPGYPDMSAKPMTAASSSSSSSSSHRSKEKHNASSSSSSNSNSSGRGSGNNGTTTTKSSKSKDHSKGRSKDNGGSSTKHHPHSSLPMGSPMRSFAMNQHHHHPHPHQQVMYSTNSLIAVGMEGFGGSLAGFNLAALQQEGDVFADDHDDCMDMHTGDALTFGVTLPSLEQDDTIDHLSMPSHRKGRAPRSSTTGQGKKSNNAQGQGLGQGSGAKTGTGTGKSRGSGKKSMEKDGVGQQGGGGGDRDDSIGTRAIADGHGLGPETAGLGPGMAILPAEDFSLLGGFSNIGSMCGLSNMGGVVIDGSHGLGLGLFSPIKPTTTNNNNAAAATAAATTKAATATTKRSSSSVALLSSTAPPASPPTHTPAITVTSLANVLPPTIATASLPVDINDQEHAHKHSNVDTTAVGLTAHLGVITNASSHRSVFGVGSSLLGGSDSLFGGGCSLLGVIDAASSGRALAEALIDCCDREDRSRLKAKNASDATDAAPAVAAPSSGIASASSGSLTAAALAVTSNDGAGSRVVAVDKDATPGSPIAAAVVVGSSAGAGAGDDLKSTGTTDTNTTKSSSVRLFGYIERVDEQRRISSSGGGSGSGAVGKNSSSSGNSSSSINSNSSSSNNSNVSVAGGDEKGSRTMDHQSMDKKRKYHDDSGNQSNSHAVDDGSGGSGNSGGHDHANSTSSADNLLTNSPLHLEMKDKEVAAAEVKRKKARQQSQSQQQHAQSRGDAGSVIVPIALSVQPSVPGSGLAPGSGPGLGQQPPQPSHASITIPRPPPIASYASRSKPHLRRITPTYIMPIGDRERLAFLLSLAAPNFR